MPDVVTVISLICLALLSLSASILAIGRLLGGRTDPDGRLQRGLVWVCALAATGLYAYVHMRDHRPPLSTHLDGLLLLAALFAWTLIFLQHPQVLPGIAGFALPVLTFLLTWCICASTFTRHQFGQMHRIWTVAHLSLLILGMLSFAVAASAGGVYLLADWRLRRKGPAPPAGKWASLESIERLLVRSAALGFALFTLGLVMGLVLVSLQPHHPGWWYAPKIILGIMAWLIYALVMNARYATHFRGRRAAWLAILGLALVLATWAVATRPKPGTQHPDTPMTLTRADPLPPSTSTEPPPCA